MNTLRTSVAQLNTTVGDIAGNLKHILSVWKDAKQAGVDLLITPELSLSGYPLEDIVENPDLLAQCGRSLEIIVELSKREEYKDCGILVGVPMKGAVNEEGRNIHNSAVLVENGEIKHV